MACRKSIDFQTVMLSAERHCGGCNCQQRDQERRGRLTRTNGDLLQLDGAAPARLSKKVVRLDDEDAGGIALERD